VPEMSTSLVGFRLVMMEPTSTPQPIDPRGPRTNQAVLAVALAAGFALDWRPVVPLFAAVLVLGAAFGPRWGPVLRLYSEVIRPRLGPPSHLEDPRPPRFAATMGVAFLVAAAVAFLAGAPLLGWGLALVVAALAALAAITGLCVGCEIWLLVARRRRVELAA
jgi:mannose/fructose/N-acetylgalactosamine-specific phosphotransferase system component IID